MAFYLGSN